MTCPHRLDGDGLTCTRLDTHDPDAVGGHTYADPHGSDLNDRHGEQVHG